MLTSSRRAAAIAACFALGFTLVAPAAHASRPDSDPDEESGGLLPGLLELVDLSDLLGELPVVGELPLLDDEFEEMDVPELEGLGLPALEGVELPALEGLGLPALDGLGLPALEGLPLGLLDDLSGPSGLNLSVLAEVSLSGAITLL